MSKPFKPMLAVTAVEEKLEFPIFATPKVDGIRGVTLDGVGYTRKLIEIPNKFIQGLISSQLPDKSDFEITAIDSNGNPLSRKNSQGAVMGSAADFRFKIWIFDNFSRPDLPYVARLNCIYDFTVEGFEVTVLRPKIINSLEELKSYHTECVNNGFEGVMLRKVGSLYKYGRSTVNEGYLLRYKSYKDAECEIIGFKEGLVNNNKAEVDNLGHTKRSSAKANKTGKGILGSFIVRVINGDFKGVEFKISKGNGIDEAFRKNVWENKEEHLGKIFTFEYDEVSGVKKPQQASFKGFRDARDI